MPYPLIMTTSNGIEKPMHKLKRWAGRLSLSLAIFLAAFIQSSFAAERAARLMPVRIGTVSRSTLDMPFLVARDRGFFREEGLEPEIVLMRSSLTVQALLAGGIDFGTATGTAVSAAVNGIDVRVIMAMSDKPSFDLFSQPSITGIQQLRGKKIGVGGLGGLTDNMIRQILLANQIALNQVTIVPVGASSITYASLKTGIIDATMLQIPQNFLAQDEGFRKLAAGADYYRIVQGGLTTTKTILSERPELVTKVVRATLRAMRFIKNDKKYSLGFMKTSNLDLGADRDRFTERTYEAAVEGYLFAGAVDDKLQREMIAVAAQRIKPPPQVAPERVFDFAITRKVVETLR
ncbi:MAG TPA: ABC transporter substrate-binding protein [Candidatus Binatia bacterium]|nr:ABC transporter substrate-binding protein [Candidatus Binatia bacterium]